MSAGLVLELAAMGGEKLAKKLQGFAEDTVNNLTRNDENNNCLHKLELGLAKGLGLFARGLETGSEAAGFIGNVVSLGTGSAVKAAVEFGVEKLISAIDQHEQVSKVENSTNANNMLSPSNS